LFTVWSHYQEAIEGRETISQNGVGGSPRYEYCKPIDARAFNGYLGYEGLAGEKQLNFPRKKAFWHSERRYTLTLPRKPSPELARTRAMKAKEKSTKIKRRKSLLKSSCTCQWFYPDALTHMLFPNIDLSSTWAKEAKRNDVCRY